MKQQLLQVNHPSSIKLNFQNELKFEFNKYKNHKKIKKQSLFPLKNQYLQK